MINNREDRTPPLASDRPHVGEYRTQYETIFGNRLPPPRIRLIHRTLPVRRKAIDAHGEAIVAAVDAVESAGEEFRQSGRGLATLIGALAMLKQERQAFIADVQQYNLDIAEYAFVVAPANVKSDALVSMLIRVPVAPTATRATPEPEDDLDNPGRDTCENLRRDPNRRSRWPRKRARSIRPITKATARKTPPCTRDCSN